MNIWSYIWIGPFCSDRVSSLKLIYRVGSIQRPWINETSQSEMHSGLPRWSRLCTSSLRDADSISDWKLSSHMLWPKNLKKWDTYIELPWNLITKQLFHDISVKHACIWVFKTSFTNQRRNLNRIAFHSKQHSQNPKCLYSGPQWSNSRWSGVEIKLFPIQKGERCFFKTENICPKISILLYRLF